MVRRLTAAELQCIALDDVAWPVTWRWHTRGPWGDTTQEVTVNVPGLEGDIAGSMRLGGLLWERSVAAATTSEMQLREWDTVCWRFADAGLPSLDPPKIGRLAGTPAARKDTPVIVLHTDHLDTLAMRRFFVPGVPDRWIEDELVTRGAFHALEALGHVMTMGLQGHLTGGPMIWMIAYPQLIEPSIANHGGVAFRRVEYLRICHHTRPAPLPSVQPWP